MRVISLLCLCGSALAFVPQMPRIRSRGMARMAVQDMIGADIETSGVFDPAGLSKVRVIPTGHETLSPNNRRTGEGRGKSEEKRRGRVL